MKNIIIIFTTVILMLSTPAFASTKAINQNIALDGINHINISHSVGNIRVKRTTAATMALIERTTEAAVAQLDGTIEASNRGWFRNTVDLDKIDLDVSIVGDTLYIVFDHDNVEADYVLTIPALDSISIKLGVGNLVALLTDKETNVKVGVGNAELTAQLENIGRIMLDTGVGDTTITGTEHQNTTRAIVTSKVQARGQGSFPVEVKIGVGNVSLELLD